MNASQVYEKGDPKNFIPAAGISRIAEALIHWQEQEKFSRVVEREELAKNDFNISPPLSGKLSARSEPSTRGPNR